MCVIYCFGCVVDESKETEKKEGKGAEKEDESLGVNSPTANQATAAKRS